MVTNFTAGACAHARTPKVNSLLRSDHSPGYQSWKVRKEPSVPEPPEPHDLALHSKEPTSTSAYVGPGTNSDQSLAYITIIFGVRN